MTPVSEWLRSTRLRQVMPETEDPWTQDYFLERLEEQSGWRLYRSTYSKYENGKQAPERDTLRKLVAFWASRGEPGPVLTPPAQPEPLDPTLALVAAINALVDELRQGRTVQVEQNAGVMAMVELLGSRLPGAPIGVHVDGPPAQTRP